MAELLRRTRHEKEGVSWHSPLDEVGRILTAADRVRLHQEVKDSYAKQGEWGIAKHLYIREIGELGQGAEVVGVMGATESFIPGLSHTPHEMYFKPDDIALWKELPQKERQDKFLREVLPNIEHVVVAVHGWDGQAMLYEPYVAHILNQDDHKPDTPDALTTRMAGFRGFDERIWMPIEDQLQTEHFPHGLEGASEHRQLATYTKQALAAKVRAMSGKTLVLSLSVMGAQQSLEPGTHGPRDEMAVQAQVYEAIDRVGHSYNQAMLTHVLQSAWKERKLELVTSLYSDISVVARDQLPSLDFDERLRQLVYMLGTEQRIARGYYMDDITGLVIGHSMGGHTAMSLFFDGIDIDRKRSTTYIADYHTHAQHMQSARDSERSNLERLAQSDDALYRQADRSIAPELFKLAHNVTKTNQFMDHHKWMDVRDAPYDTLGNSYFQAWMPVVSGDNVLWRPDWLVRSNLGVRKRSKHVLLTQDPLINLMHLLHRHGLTGLRKMLLAAGRTVGVPGKSSILRSRVRRYVGLGVPDAASIEEQYEHGIVHDPGAVNAETRILSEMKASFGDVTRAEVKESELARLRVYGGTADETLQPAFIHHMAQAFGRAGLNVPAYLYHELRGAGHHPRVEDIPQITSDFYSALLMYNASRVTQHARDLERVKARLETILDRLY